MRTASLAYDAVALVAALVKTQGKQRFSETVLTNSSGFTGIDGLFRFRPDGTNQRGLAVLAGVADRRSDHQPAAQGLWRVGDVRTGSGREIGHHGVEHGKARERHPQRPSAVGSTAPCSRRRAMRRGSSGRPASRA